MTLRGELDAIAGFLQSAEAYPSAFAAALPAQLDAACAVIETRKWSVQQGAEALASLADTTVWNAKEKEMLATKIQANLETVSAMVQPPRQHMQDYIALPYYFSDGLWQKMLSQEISDMGKCTYVAELAIRLGLRAPTETTSQFLTALLMVLPGSALDRSSPVACHNSFVAVKKHFKNVLSQAGGLPSNSIILEKLPM